MYPDSDAGSFRAVAKGLIKRDPIHSSDAIWLKDSEYFRIYIILILQHRRRIPEGLFNTWRYAIEDRVHALKAYSKSPSLSHCNSSQHRRPT